LTAPIAPAPQSLFGFAGSTVVANFTFTRPNSATPPVQVPVDLTGASIWMTVKVRQSDPDPGIVQLTIGQGIVVTSLLGGTATAMIDNTVTDDLDPPISLYYDVKVKESNGVYSTPIFGQLILNAPITDAS
jgi:hypothetical protein